MVRRSWSCFNVRRLVSNIYNACDTTRTICDGVGGVERSGLPTRHSESRGCGGSQAQLLAIEEKSKRIGRGAGGGGGLLVLIRSQEHIRVFCERVQEQHKFL